MIYIFFFAKYRFVCLSFWVYNYIIVANVLITLLNVTSFKPNRGYSQSKIQENVQAEIMQVILEEARESYNASIVHEVESNEPEDMENTITLVEDWLTEYIEGSSSQ
eukprot:m.164158 g.164158  ORF g.164158 m.164158 type:complete len:107 (-) comp16401_c2_seq2:143-463(-)